MIHTRIFLLFATRTHQLLSKILISGCQPPMDELHQKAINHQRKIGWNNFSRGRISKQFIITMNEHYKQKKRTSSFTGIGWIKQVINFVLSTHIDEWYHRCDSNSHPNQISFQNTFMSLEKRSLLITIEFFYSKAEILPVDLKIWFKYAIEELESHR